MDEKKLFIAQMDKLIKYGRDNDNLVTKKDIDEYFKDISLDEEKNSSSSISSMMQESALMNPSIPRR